MTTQPTHTPKTKCKYCSCDLLDHNFDGSDKCNDIGTKYKTQVHAPTPWEVAHYEDGILAGTNFIRESDKDNSIAILSSTNEQEKANAAFIVRAVNAHEELLAEVKEEARMLQHYSPDSARLAHLKNAIARAEAK